MTTESFDAGFPLRTVFFLSATTVLGTVEELALVEGLEDILLALKICTQQKDMSFAAVSEPSIPQLKR